MNLYLRAFLLTLAANAGSILPLMLFHRIGWFDSIGMVILIAATGPLVALKAIFRGTVAPERKEEMVIMSALGLPMLMLVVHAAVWSAVHYQDTGRVLPESNMHWLAIVAALLGFSAWCFTGVYFNSRQRRIEGLKPTPHQGQPTREAG